MNKLSILFSQIFSILLLTTTVNAQNAGTIEETVTVLRPDSSNIEVLISRPDTTLKIPVLMVIDGSVCLPSKPSSLYSRLSPENIHSRIFARVIVEKPDPTIPEADEEGNIRIGPDFQCSENFKKYYSIDQRVFDHLHAIQKLRREAPWWNGKLYILGFSDGSRIASRVGIFTPETEKMTLVAYGGGISMADEFKNFHVCHPERTDNRSACIEELDKIFNEMRQNPTYLKTWNGDSNTWKVWASRLNEIGFNILSQANFPFLIVHGSEDRSIPVSSARILDRGLKEIGFSAFDYWEIEGMGHGLGSGLTTGQTNELYKKVMNWLFPEDD